MGALVLAAGIAVVGLDAGVAAAAPPTIGQAAVRQVVAPVPSAAVRTSMSLGTSMRTPNASARPVVTVTATVKAGGRAAKGTAAFYDGTKRLRTVRLTSGRARCTLPGSLRAGAHRITVVYTSADRRPVRMRSALRVTLRDPATVSLSTRTPAFVRGRTASPLSVSVKAGRARATGVVYLYDGSRRLASLRLVSGSARYTLPATLSVGTHKITARYPTSSTALGSSATLWITVVAPPTPTASPVPPTAPTLNAAPTAGANPTG